MGAIKAVTPYAKEVIWSIPANVVSGVVSSFTAIPLAMKGASLPPEEVVQEMKVFKDFAPWLGKKICNLGTSFFHGGVKACLDARKHIREASVFSMDVLSGAIGKLGGKGAAFGALFVLGAGALSYMGWNIFRGEHKVLKDISNGFPGDTYGESWLHWGKFLSGTSMLAGGLAAIFAPAIAPQAFIVAISAFATDKALDFVRWLARGRHWFNVPLKAPLGLSSYLRQNNYDLRI